MSGADVTAIGMSAFAKATGLTEDKFGSSCFAGCTGLTYIGLPSSLQEMGIIMFSLSCR